MKKFSLFPAIFLLIFVSCVYGGTVTVTDAQNVALNFFKVNNPNFSSHVPLTAVLKYTKTEADNSVDFYVFDIIAAKGFVIVSANDNVIPVLGYSTEGYFVLNPKNTGFNHWVSKTTTNIRLALQNNAVADARIKNQWSAYRSGQNPGSEKNSSVSPLCSTTWDQENDVTTPPPYIYNLFCPFNNTDQQRCLTGCVATAQAQIMKYWNFPVQGSGSYSYDDAVSNGYSYNYGIQSADFAAHTYKWPSMPSVLTGTESLSDDSAVDLLMYDCAVSLGMDFGDDNEDGSGAEALLSIEWDNGQGDSICTQTALVNYFSYDVDSINGVIEANYSASAWTNLIEHELNMKRPVLYEGDDATQGGHAWVCDGYNTNNYLHMNWGWGGYQNGYFAINNLTTAGNFNPVLDDDALIGIVPNAPKARFSANSTTTCTGAVQFHDNSMYWPTSWNWNFGDNTTSTEQNPQHTYAASGTYTVTLTVSGQYGTNAKTITDYITVDANISLSSTTTPANAGQSNGTATVDYTGGVSPYTFKWSNGATTQSINDVPAETYTVTATDKNGCQQTTTATVHSIATGINELNANSPVIVYPNPSSASWQLVTGNDWIGAQIEIFDINGREIFRGDIESSKSNIDLDVSPGIYFMKISLNEASANIKLVKL